MWLRKIRHFAVVLVVFVMVTAAITFSPCARATATIMHPNGLEMMPKVLNNTDSKSDAVSIGINILGQNELNLTPDYNSIVASKQTISVMTNSPTGYHVTLSSINEDQTMANSSSAINPIGGGILGKTGVLTPNTWGYAIAGKQGFNKNYSEHPSLTSKWAAIAPYSHRGDVVVIDSNNPSNVNGDTQDIWFGVRLGDAQSITAGTYTRRIVYTATADLPTVPTITSVTPNRYNLGDTNYQATVDIRGTSLKTANAAWIDTNENGQMDVNEQCTDVTIISDNRISCIVTDKIGNNPGVYDVYVSNITGTGKLQDAFTLVRQPEVFSMSPNRYNLFGSKPVSMVGGEYHHMILTSDGSVYSWGEGDRGQLGNGETERANEPMNITGLLNLDKDEKVVQVSALGWHSLALTNTGDVYSWGANEAGQVGNNSTTDALRPINITAGFDLDDDDYITRIYAGWDSSYALSNNGVIYSWGNNGYGQLGTGDTNSRTTPTRVTFDLGRVIAFATDSHALALNDAGQLYVWGYGGQGQLGNGSTQNSIMPINITSQVNLSSGDTIVDVKAGSNSSMVLTSQGAVYGWGQNSYGSLGIGNTHSPDTPTRVTFFDSHPAKQLAAGYHFTIALTTDNKVYVYGRNGDGQLGLGGFFPRDKDTPTEMNSLRDITINVSATGNSLFALTNTGEIYYWGSGDRPASISSSIDYSDVAIYGVNLNNVSRVFVDLNRNGSYNANEVCSDLYIASGATIVNCRMPSDRGIELGVYDVYVEFSDSATIKLEQAMEYYFESNIEVMKPQKSTSSVAALDKRMVSEYPLANRFDLSGIISDMLPDIPHVNAMVN